MNHDNDEYDQLERDALPSAAEMTRCDECNALNEDNDICGSCGCTLEAALTSKRN